MSREMEMVLLCVRLALREVQHGARGTEHGVGSEDGEDAPMRIRQLLAGSLPALDFEEVIRLARHHRVIPLVYRGLAAVADHGARSREHGAQNKKPGQDASTSSASSPHAPCSMPDVLARFRAMHIANAARNIRLTEELFRILDLFEKAGIKAIPVKGPALAVQAYGDLSLRQFDDLDFLLRLKDMMPAGDILKANGYKPRLDLPPASMRKYLKSGQDWPFRNEELGMSVDLNSVIVSHVLPQPFTVEELLPRLRDTAVCPNSPNGQALTTLPPEDLILILCLHGTHHAWERLIWLADVAALLATARTDIPLLKQKAREAGLARAVDLLLCLLADLELYVARLPVPRTVIPSLAGFCTRALTGKQSTAGLWAFQARMLDRWSDRLRFVLRKLFVPSTVEWNSPHLNGPLRWLAAPLRPFRLLVRFCHRAAPRLVRQPH